MRIRVIGIVFVSLSISNLLHTAPIDWNERISRLEHKVGASKLNLKDPSHLNIKWHFKKSKHLLRNYVDSPGRDKELYASEKEVLDNYSVLINGGALSGDHLREEAHFSWIDRSLQPFLTYHSPKIKKKKEWPLFVYLHHYSPTLNWINWKGLPKGLMDLADEEGYIIAAPFARGNTDFQGVGERDVLKVIEEMKRRYPIDSKRVFLVGISMGGMGCYTIAAHYPHLFAGVVVISARGDYYTWKGLERSEVPKYLKRLIDAEFGASLKENLKSVPFYVVHGSDDYVVQREEFEVMEASLSEGHKENQFKLIAGGNHWIYEEALEGQSIRDWLLNKTLSQPLSFSYLSYNSKYNQAYWTMWPHEIPSGQKVEISSRILDSEMEIKAPKLSKIQVHQYENQKSGKLLKINNLNNLELVLSSENSFETWRPDIIKDIFTRPFILVRGRGYSKEDFDQRKKEWLEYAQSPPLWLDEENWRDNLTQEFGIIVYGEPELSPLVKKTIEVLPIQYTKDHFFIQDRAFGRKGQGLFALSKSKEHKGIAIQCGRPWGESLESNHIYDDLPGFILYSTPSWYGEEEVLAAGFFKSSGEIDSETLYIAEEISK